MAQRSCHTKNADFPLLLPLQLALTNTKKVMSKLRFTRLKVKIPTAVNAARGQGGSGCAAASGGMRSNLNLSIKKCMLLTAQLQSCYLTKYCLHGAYFSS